MNAPITNQALYSTSIYKVYVLLRQTYYDLVDVDLQRCSDDIGGDAGLLNGGHLRRHLLERRALCGCGCSTLLELFHLQLLLQVLRLVKKLLLRHLVVVLQLLHLVQLRLQLVQMLLHLLQLQLL